ncbi:hypothetical protein MUP46_04720 [Patescibacteria group bacterium]|nr:hypothetical protein [Patescibacteria group bacterium]
MTGNITFAGAQTVDGVDISAIVDRIVQVVNTQTGALATGATIMPRDDTIPQNTEGNEFMSLAITPSSAANKLRIDVVWNGVASTGSVDITVALFQDAIANALACASDVSYGQDDSNQICFTHYMTAGTINPITFKVRAGMKAAGTTTFNGENTARLYGGVFASSITITEIRG